MVPLSAFFCTPCVHPLFLLGMPHLVFPPSLCPIAYRLLYSLLENHTQSARSVDPVCLVVAVCHPSGLECNLLIS